MRKPLSTYGLLFVSSSVCVWIDLQACATESCPKSSVVSVKHGTLSQTSIETSSAHEVAGDLPYKYVGNNFSAKFHRPSCPFAKIMSGHNVVLFHFRNEAIAACHNPCRYCLPPVWKSVKCLLINPNNSQSCQMQKVTAGKNAVP